MTHKDNKSWEDSGKMNSSKGIMGFLFQTIVLSFTIGNFSERRDRSEIWQIGFFKMCGGTFSVTWNENLYFKRSQNGKFYKRVQFHSKFWGGFR